MTCNRKTCLLAPCTLALILGGGCAGVNNDRSALTPDPIPLEPATAASVGAVSRANWQRREYVVEPDVLEHHPTYTALRPISSESTAAQTGAHPTPESAIPSDNNPGAQSGDGIAAPFIAGWEVVRMPVLAVMNWPGSIATMDPAWFDRYREPTTNFDFGTMEQEEGAR